MSGIAVIYAQGAAKPLRVFFRDDDVIKYLYWNIRRENDGSITEYSQVESLAEGAGGNPTAMYTPDSRMEHVFFSDGKGNIVQIIMSIGMGDRKEYWSGEKDAAAHPRRRTPTAVTPTVSTPSAIYAFEWNRRLHVFHRDQTGNIIATCRDPDLGPDQYPWSGPETITGGNAAAGNPVSLYAPHEDCNVRYMIFYRDIEGNIIQVTPNKGSGRGTQLNIWSDAKKDYKAGGDPVAHCMSDNGIKDILRVLYRDTEGNIIEAYRLSDTEGPTTIKPVAGPASKRADAQTKEVRFTEAVGIPGFTYDTDTKKLHLFYRDDKGNIIHVEWPHGNCDFQSKVWSGPDTIQETSKIQRRNTLTDKAIDDPVAYYTSDDKRLHVFYRASRRGLVHVYLKPGSDKLHVEDF